MGWVLLIMFALESGQLPFTEQHRTWPDCEDAAMRWRMEWPNTPVVCLPASVLGEEEDADGVTGKAKARVKTKTKAKAKVKQRP